MCFSVLGLRLGYLCVRVCVCVCVCVCVRACWAEGVLRDFLGETKWDSYCIRFHQ